MLLDNRRTLPGRNIQDVGEMHQKAPAAAPVMWQVLSPQGADWKHRKAKSSLLAMLGLFDTDNPLSAHLLYFVRKCTIGVHPRNVIAAS